MNPDPTHPQTEAVRDLLREGIAAAKSGQRAHARELLTRVVSQDEGNLAAWLWLSGVVESPDDREVCLENVLTLDPDNGAARKGLATLRRERIEGWLRDGIAAAKSDQRARARDLLVRVVEQDEENVLAWLWLSGVVESPDDREVCLENVLTLDPDNDVARRGLALVRQRKGTEARPQSPPPDEAAAPFHTEGSTVAPSHTEGSSAAPSHTEGSTAASPTPEPESPLAMRSKTPATPASAVLRQDFARRRPPQEPEPEPPPAQDEFDDDYLCPYCLAPTQHEDRKCKACGGNLWVRFRKYEKRSTWLWVALLMQGSATFQSAIPLIVLSYFIFSSGSGESPGEVYKDLAELVGVSSGAAQTGIYVVFVVTLLIFLFSLAVLIALYVRWKPVFYLFVASATLELFWAMVNVIMSISPAAADASPFGRGGLACGGLIVLLALARLWLAFQIQEDFTFDKRRILFRLDPDVTSGPMFLARGHDYVERKMWGLAALHMRRAIGFMPHRMDGRPSLVLTYLKLKRYDRAARTLEEARQVSPDDPRLEELQTLLDDMRSADAQPKRP